MPGILTEEYPVFYIWNGYISVLTGDIKLESGGIYETGYDWIREDGWKHG